MGFCRDGERVLRFDFAFIVVFRDVEMKSGVLRGRILSGYIDGRFR